MRIQPEALRLMALSAEILWKTVQVLAADTTTHFIKPHFSECEAPTTQPKRKGHFSRCPKQYKHYCIKGRCRLVVAEQTPSCVCDEGYTGARCERVDLFYLRGDRGQILVICLIAVMVIFIILVIGVCTCCQYWNFIHVPVTKSKPNPNHQRDSQVPKQQYLKSHTIPNPKAKSNADTNYESQNSIPRKHEVAIAGDPGWQVCGEQDVELESLRVHQGGMEAESMHSGADGCSSIPTSAALVLTLTISRGPYAKGIRGSEELPVLGHVPHAEDHTEESQTQALHIGNTFRRVAERLLYARHCMRESELCVHLELLLCWRR
ncbi:Probetacellulin [Fukomys damarensis]|uniref:Probetacellulin n=1 Tax=Fukomys damarensis TaxID=885580 RepID=A0A091D7S8_FUKDA|nr:Probetacellulin [Fukomys damarensis]